MVKELLGLARVVVAVFRAEVPPAPPQIVVSGSSDVVIEAARGGTDTVRTSVDDTLAAGQEIEVLQVDGGTTSGLALTGNASPSSLIGGAGDNRLAGGGSTDSLSGGSGRDTFVFEALSDSSVGANKDTVRSFVLD